MADITTFTTVANGDKRYEGYYNGIYTYKKTWDQTNYSVYTGSGFNSSTSTSPYSGSYIMYLASGNQILNYVNVFCNTYTYAYSVVGASTVYLYIGTAVSGGSVFTSQISGVAFATSSSEDCIGAKFHSIIVPYFPTAQEKASGLAIKFVSYSTGQGASLSNLKTTALVY